MTTSERQSRLIEARIALRDAIENAQLDIGAVMRIADEYAAVSQAHAVATCHEATGCAFCAGWLSGHDQR